MSSTVGAKRRSTPAASRRSRSAAKGRGVAGEVFGGGELERVDEDAGGDEVGFGAGGGDERQVAVMEGAHGRHKGEGPVAVAEGFEGGAGFRDGAGDLHLWSALDEGGGEGFGFNLGVRGGDYGGRRVDAGGKVIAFGVGGKGAGLDLVAESLGGLADLGAGVSEAAGELGRVWRARRRWSQGRRGRR